MSKLSASLIVLLMALSALVYIPPESLGEPASTSNIYVPVVSGGFPVTDAWVNLTNVHTGAVLASEYAASKSAYVVSNAPSGYYRVDVVDKNNVYYDQQGALEFRFDGFSNYTSSLIQLTAFPYKAYTWNVTVRNPSNQLMGAGVVVGFYDFTNREFVAKGTTNSLSYVNLAMFESAVLGDVYLVVIKAGYQTYVEPVTVTADNTTTIQMANHQLVSSYITQGGDPATNVVAYLINTDSSIPWVKRVMRSTGSAMAFSAYNGNFILVVDADGAYADVRTVAIPGTSIPSIINLPQQTKRTEKVSVTYGANFNSFSAAVDTVWSHDDAYPGLMLKDMGSLRMQVDLMLGNGDGTLDAGEVAAFYNKVNSYGSQFISSSNLLVVNDTVYESALAITGYTMDLASGSVVSTTGVHYAYTCQYTSHTAIYIGANSYTASAWARYDSSPVDYNYTIALPSSYELVDSSSTSLVAVSGYQTVYVDPLVGTAGSGELVALTLEKSLNPVAKAGILDSSYSYAVKDSGGNVTRYIVAMNQNVTLTASGSDDPNKNPLKYTWNFGDGSPVEQTTNLTIVHNYTTAQSLTVNLTVTDVVGYQNWADISVVCDNLAPTPSITVKDKVPDGDMIDANQREVIWFNATSSVDDAVASGDLLGVIASVQFDWGDGNKSSVIQWTDDQQNTSKSYERSGTYTITLNVTDVVGHLASKTMTVEINDTEAPKVSYVVRNDTWVATYVENTTLHFDANGTSDNVDAIGALNFSWDFADGSPNWNGTGAEGAWNVTHAYNKTGEFNVALNVTDSTGNFKVERKLVKVVAGPRPDLYVELVDYDPKNFTEGKTGTILVNITNRGSVNATNIQVDLYIVTADGKQKLVTGTETIWLNETQVTVVEPGQKVQFRLEYTPGGKGTFVIRVNITCDDQLRPFSYTTSDDQNLHVKQAAWKQWALWGGVLAIIVLIPLLLMLRGRLAKREKKGPRREKKEREREKVSDEEL